MKRLLTMLIVLILGLGAGAGAAYGVGMVLGPPPPKSAKPRTAPVATAFIPAGAIVAPIVTGDGNLSGYASFDVQLEVAETDVDKLTAQVPLLLHAVNMRTWRTPMAAGKQKILPDLDVFGHIVADAAREAMGKGAVRRVVVVNAKPM